MGAAHDAAEQGPVSPARETLLWIALLAALSPVVLDWARHLVAEPAVRYAAVFVPLVLHLARQCPERAPRRPLALWLVVAALALSVLAVGGALSRFGRLAVPLAVCALAAWLGRPKLSVAALALWAIPVPGFLLKTGGMLLEKLPSGPLPLTGGDCGLPLAALLSGLAYHAALVRGERVASGVRSAALWALLAIPAQALAVALASGIAALHSVEAARALLTHAPGFLAAAIAAWILLGKRRRPRQAGGLPCGQRGFAPR